MPRAGVGDHTRATAGEGCEVGHGQPQLVGHDGDAVGMIGDGHLQDQIHRHVVLLFVDSTQWPTECASIE